MASSNKFRRVNEPDPKCVTVTIWEDNGSIRGEATGPIQLQAGSLSASMTAQDGSLSVEQALNSAITLAKKHNVEIVVCDTGNVWDQKWGILT